MQLPHPGLLGVMLTEAVSGWQEVKDGACKINGECVPEVRA